MAEKFEYTRTWLDADAFPMLGFTRNWENPEDYPTVELEEAKVRQDMQSLHDETKDYINEKLIPAVLASDATEAARTAAEEARASAEELRSEAEQARVSSEASRAEAEETREDAESSRAEAESSRASAESARVSAESQRASAEGTRVEAESGRASAEQGRVSAETARAQAESVRADAELTRAYAEAARVLAEQSRASAEQARSQAENLRLIKESERVSAEDARIAAENAREVAEDDRSTAEGLRVEAESSRASAEQARSGAEVTRGAQEAARSQAEANRVSAEQARAAAESTRLVSEQARSTAEQQREIAEAARIAADSARNKWEDYDPSHDYVPGNKVAHNGSSYLNISSCRGIAPPNTGHWLLIAERGQDGTGVGDFLADGSVPMTGPLTLSGNPTAPLHATPKSYVDSLVPLVVTITESGSVFSSSSSATEIYGAILAGREAFARFNEEVLTLDSVGLSEGVYTAEFYRPAKSIASGQSHFFLVQTQNNSTTVAERILLPKIPVLSQNPTSAEDGQLWIVVAEEGG